MPLPVLRPYQERDLNAIRGAFKQHQAVLLTQPCGAGKGTLASFIVQSAASRGKKVVFLVDRRTLVNDMADRLTRLGLEFGVIMGDDKRRAPWLPVHVASIDTVTRRENVPFADLLIVDEARFSSAPKWKKVFDRYPNAKILGMDATPCRLDGIGLGRHSGGIFDHLVVGPTAQELIDQGYLVRSHVIAPPPVAAPSKMVGGEFNAGAVSEACDKNQIIGDMIRLWERHSHGWKTVAFGADKKHGTHVAERFREAGIEATTVFDDTPETERRKIWDDFDHGSLKIIASVGVVSYGWDHSICKCVLDLAHTMSLSAAIQKWARGSRPHKGHDHFVLIDQVGNIDRRSALAPNGFGFYEDDRQWNLEGKAIRMPDEDDDTSPGIIQCSRCYHRFRAGKKACPGCGYVFPVRERQIIEDRDKELVVREREARIAKEKAEAKAEAIANWKSRMNDDDRRRKYEEWKRIGTERNYKPMWPKVTYRAVFGKWPSKMWDIPTESIAEEFA